MTAAETEPTEDRAQRFATPEDAEQRGDRAYHLARVCEGLSTKVTDPERARRLARLLGEPIPSGRPEIAHSASSCRKKLRGEPHQY